ncbi:MAG: tyrosine-type recombinase/integrase [Bacteroidetes bacterium]|nr:tyrosine-type recombinase/integrase [Bacteroidota bacterium]
MLNEKKSYTTIGIYTRNLRTIFNEAIESGDVNQNFYPFGNNKYQPPQSANNKGLWAKDLQKILKHKPEENTWEEYAKDIWTFSLLCQGVNMKDIANIRYRNIQGGQLVFIREKTKRTKRAEQMPIVVYLGKEALDIIKKWGHENKSPNQLVFPIYSDENTPLRNLRLVEQQTKMINKYMRKIATDLKIKQDFTFYAARHSFATVLKRQGRSTEEIQEFLGHATKKTTELYLGSFSDNHKRNVMRDFVKGLKNA